MTPQDEHDSCHRLGGCHAAAGPEAASNPRRLRGGRSRGGTKCHPQGLDRKRPTHLSLNPRTSVTGPHFEANWSIPGQKGPASASSGARVERHASCIYPSKTAIEEENSMARPSLDTPYAMNAEDCLTLLDLIAAVDEFAESDAEVLATLRHMFETGHVHFDELPIEELPWAA